MINLQDNPGPMEAVGWFEVMVFAEGIGCMQVCEPIALRLVGRTTATEGIIVELATRTCMIHVSKCLMGDFQRSLSETWIKFVLANLGLGQTL